MNAHHGVQIMTENRKMSNDGCSLLTLTPFFPSPSEGRGEERGEGLDSHGIFTPFPQIFDLAF
jgi:hypothetical protein